MISVGEADLIASVLADSDALYDAQGTISAKDFSDSRYGAVWRVFEDMAAQGKKIDLVTVKNYVQINGLVEEVGGLAFLVDLSSAYVSGRNAAEYAKYVAEASKIRTIKAGIEDIVCDGKTADSESLIERLEQLLISVENVGSQQEPVELKTLFDDGLKNIIDCMERGQTGITGISSGFRDLDEQLAGLHGSELIILAGRPSMGKSTFMLNMARKMAKKNIPVLIFSLEMSASNLNNNMAVAEFKIDAQRFRKMQLSIMELEEFVASSDSYSKLPIYIIDQGGMSIGRMQSISKRWHRKHGIKAIFVDYLQLLTDRSESNKSREQEVASISRNLKRLAKDLDIPVIALSQLSRNNTKRNDCRPMLSDLRESGAIEQDADVVLFIHREEYYTGERQGIAEIIISKQRNGPVGSIDTSFIESQLRFEDATVRQYSEYKPHTEGERDDL